MPKSVLRKYSFCQVIENKGINFDKFSFKTPVSIELDDCGQVLDKTEL